MGKSPDDRGLGWLEWVLIVILILMVLVTAFFLLRPALVLFWENTLQSIQQ